MDQNNLKLPAYPAEVAWDGNLLQDGHQTDGNKSAAYGFYKARKGGTYDSAGICLTAVLMNMALST